MKPRNQKLVSGALGAALAAAVVVTVYEGGVVVAGRGGGSTTVKAGEHLVLTADGRSGAVATGPEIMAPDPTATRDQLLARDELQRQRIAGLSSRIGELERQLAEGGGGGGGGDGELGEDGLDHGQPWYDPSKEQLAEFAKKCKVRFDIPPISDSSPFVLPADEAAADGISDAEAGSMNQVFAELQRAWTDRIRAIYLDVVGESNAEAGLSAQAMMREIEDKSPPGERAALQARVAQERAGLAEPPADWSHASPIERMIRSLAAIGDETEHALAVKLGPERARELRRKHGGWPMKAEWSGCDR